MRKKIFSALISYSLVLASSKITAQDDPAENYIPDTIEKIVDRPAQNESEKPLKEKINEETIANSIFLYEGYEGIGEIREGNIARVFMENYEREVKNASPLRYYESTRDLEYAEEIPFEREMYSALGKTLIEKYKFFREVDQGIKKLRDATTIKIESNSGVNYRLGPFINKAETGEIGAFLKIKNGKFNMAFLACQNEIESYIERRAFGLKFRLSQNYKTGANGDKPERETYFSIGR